MTATADLEAAAAHAVESAWGWHPASVRRVSSDVEETFLIGFEPGPGSARPEAAVLKVAEPGRDPGWFAFEADVVELALEHDADLPLARGIRTPAGEAIVEVPFTGGPRVARLMRQLPGVASHRTSPDMAARHRIGRVAGRLSAVLARIGHPAAGRRVPWDLRGVPALAGALGLVEDPICRAMVESVLGAHDDLMRCAEERSPARLSHNDLNGGNILVSAPDAGAVTGIIDFGDAALSPRVFDVGIAVAYAGADAAASGGPPWPAAAAFARGYREEAEIAGDEFSLVPALARARLAQRVLIAADRAAACAAAPTRDDRAWLLAAQRDLRAIMESSPADEPGAPEEWR